MLILSACSSSMVEEEIASTLDKMTEIEETYNVIQSELVTVELNEQKLFTEAMKLTTDEQNNLQELVLQLQDSLQERKNLIQKEIDAMQQAKQASEAIQDFIHEATDKEKVANLNEAIQQRYATHENFTDAYQALLEAQQQLYTLLDKHHVQLEQLTAKVDEVNSKNIAVQKEIEQFNEDTQRVNALKATLFSSLE